jgi:hypothetical protein
MTVVMSIASMSWRALGRIEHRRLAAPHDMTRPAHGGRRIDQHDLADHHPVEQMAQGGEAQFRGRSGTRLLQLLDIGGDMHALDCRDLRHAASREPVEEFQSRARIGAARVRVANVGGEEFKEAIGGARAGGADKGGSAVGDKDELVHTVTMPASLASVTN